MNGIELKFHLEHKQNSFKIRTIKHEYLKVNTECTDDLSDGCVTDLVIERTKTQLKEIKESGQGTEPGCEDFCIPGTFINNEVIDLLMLNQINFTVNLPASKTLKNISMCKTVKQVSCLQIYFAEAYKQVLENEMCQRHCQKYEYEGKRSYKVK